MGCFFSPQSIHPNQMVRQNMKQGRKVKIIDSKVNFKYTYCSSRQNISNTTQNINEIRQPINGQALVLVQKAISKHFLFYDLSQNERHQLIKLMRRYSVFKDYYIFRKGDIATTFFIIVSGKVQLQTGLSMYTFLEKGQSFGELALIYDAPRSVSVVARQQTILWGIEAHIFNKFMNRLRLKNLVYIRGLLNKVSFFSFLNQKQKQNLVMSSHKFKYQIGSKIFSVKDPANSIFIVIQGRIQMDIPNKPKVLFQKGEMFGQGCLLGDQFRSGTAWCIQQTVCLSISKNSLLKQLGVQVNNILFYCICKWALKRSNIFNLLKRLVVDKIIFSGQMKIVEDGTIIEQKGKPTYKLYICLQGKINSSGVGSIFNQIPQQSGTTELVKQQKGYVYSIKLDLLTRILNRPLKTFVETKEKKVKIKTGHMETLDDFIIIQKIQEKYISQKLLVTTYSEPKSKYIMYCFKKVNIVQSQHQERVKKYIKTMTAMTNELREHPLIPKIIKTFNSDIHYLFIVRQFAGTLFLSDVIQDSSLCSELKQNARFYWACLIQIVSYLHSHNLRHNNINPQSFIVGENGYLYAEDLFYIEKGSSKERLTKKQISTHKNLVQQQDNQQFEQNRGEIKIDNAVLRTSTITGLPHYLAPEVVCGGQGSIESDLWSIGILMYQILFGKLPYGQNCSDIMQIYSDILYSPLQFPEQQQTGCNLQKQKQIIQSLLKIEPNDRQSLKLVKKHKYFSEQEQKRDDQQITKGESQQKKQEIKINYFQNLRSFLVKPPCFSKNKINVQKNVVFTT